MFHNDLIIIHRCKIIKAFSIVFLCLPFANTLFSQPDLSSRRMVRGIPIYSDAKIKSVFYYLPNDIKIKTVADSTPDFKFIMMRYVGTKVTGDQGAFENQNIVRFNVVVPPYKQPQLKSIKDNLALTGISNIELKPIPINRIEAFLVFPFISKDLSAPAKDSALVVRSSFFSQTSSKWEEKNIVLKLDNAAAQIFDETLKENKAMMSLAFAYYTSGTYPSGDIIFNGFGKYTKQIKDLIQANQLSDSSKIAIVKTGNVEIIVNPKKCGDCVKKVEVADYVPADYPTLEIYCYDFNNRIRNDLYAKKIEVEATSVSGQKISSVFTFKNTSPDTYAGNLSFDYAIRLDNPPSYKVTEIYFDGRVQKGEWIKKATWNGIIDITTQTDN